MDNFAAQNFDMILETKLSQTLSDAIRACYSLEMAPETLVLQKTRKEFTGDFTFVCFPLTKVVKKSPEAIGDELGQWSVAHQQDLLQYNVVKGFLNIQYTPEAWLAFLESCSQDDHYGFREKQGGKPVVIEFSSPNTNKPLHLGHIRNNLIGDAVSRILEAAGKTVIRVNLVNDRGIHICKSMLAWQKWGEGETPETAGLKGDHLVGRYYVLFDKHYKAEVKALTEAGMDPEKAALEASLMQEAREMLRRWEMKDPEVIGLWERMNAWVYKGFDQTYERLGIWFDHIYYESETYLLGKSIVEEGLNSGAFYRKEDGSVWCDLTADGLDEKILLRSDGTSVYITQDLGTAEMRAKAFHPEQLIYVVGNEQNYHFDVLKLILKKSGRAWADQIVHLSYGMVELPDGKMKSREGTVVDADDLIEEMEGVAETTTRTLGKIDGFSAAEAADLFHMLALGAVKFYILKVDPKKTMIFNPEESIDFNGNTGPFIQYTHARICSLEQRVRDQWNEQVVGLSLNPGSLSEVEENLIKELYAFPQIVQQAAAACSPALIANYTYELAKLYNHYYQEYPVLREENRDKARFRLFLAVLSGRVIRKAMSLLGIDVPNRM